jgi:hypothetical protein
VPGCGGPLARWPKTEVAWLARAGWRGAPPCCGHCARGHDNGAAGVCSPVAPVWHGRWRENRGGEAHPPATNGEVGLTGGVGRRQGRKVARRGRVQPTVRVTRWSATTLGCSCSCTRARGCEAWIHSRGERARDHTHR